MGVKVDAMLKMSEIRELIKLIDQSSLDELELEKEGFRLALRKRGANASGGADAASFRQVPVSVIQSAAPFAYGASAPALPAAAPPAGGQAQAAPAAAPDAPAHADGQAGQAGGSRDDKGLHKIVSPMVGTFYRAPAPDAPPYVNPGDRVDEKTVVCIIEAMKLMNEIEAEVKGVIVDVLVENGQLVEYGQPLFLVKTD